MAKGRNYKAEYARRKALKVVRASETKRGGTYSKAYRERLIRNLQKGKTRQQARGHKPQEHIDRREKEIAKQGLTNDQIRIVFKWAENRWYNVHDTTDVEYPWYVVEWAKKQGYDHFQVYRHAWEKLRRDYLARGRETKFSLETLQQYATEMELNLPPGSKGEGDVSWLYYH